jgi:TPR repeat protein
MRVVVAALAALMVIGSAAGARASDTQDCKSTKIGADKSAVAAACTRLAEKGEGWAQCYLGFLYTAGLGVPQDGKAAAEWYRKAAEQGVALCQLLSASSTPKASPCLRPSSSATSPPAA